MKNKLLTELEGRVVDCRYDSETSGEYTGFPDGYIQVSLQLVPNCPVAHLLFTPRRGSFSFTPPIRSGDYIEAQADKRTVFNRKTKDQRIIYVAERATVSTDYRGVTLFEYSAD